MIAGNNQAYQKMTFSWEGPALAEDKATFLNYKMEMRFTDPDGNSINVPGYFAADGNAGETSAESGNIWRAHLLPLKAGKWEYEVSFLEGGNIALASGNSEGTSLAFDGQKGNFTVTPADESQNGFLGKGKLQYIGEHFLQFTNGDYFFKMGANAPEVFLQYKDFDGTASERDYKDHVADWKAGDLLWQGDKGKGIVGVINYLKEQGINSHYFLLMNAYGDGKAAFPWKGKDDYYLYDVSKLDQWQVLFDYMMQEGMMTQFVLSEQENQSYFENNEGGDFADSRKIYYRELVARFGYLNAVTWNIGEENGWEKEPTYGKSITTSQRKQFAAYLSDLLPYEDLIVVHNGPSSTDAIFEDLLGDPSYSGISFQGNYQDVTHGYGRMLHWRNASAAAGRPWVVTYDEPYSSPEYPELDVWRKNSLWASLMAGAAGMEVYIGKGEDLVIQDYRKYAAYWEIMNHAKNFFTESGIPFQRLTPMTTEDNNSWVLSVDEEVFVVYLREGGEGELNLPSEVFEIHWFDPRTGEWSRNEALKEALGGEKTALGKAPSQPDLDWVILLKKKKD
ncbi:hypothetical protein CQA01_21460 [Cyclobacterium qasimii]|uniref:DUF5060 domain-containing protein n=2 Tax=Cyclobacterium qasimii TaxID=1350429 RepID=A0A512CBM3_9BACT|nr:hypothetical protein CQA01_21460 [Cyclobacterium qasimii]